MKPTEKYRKQTTKYKKSARLPIYGFYASIKTQLGIIGGSVCGSPAELPIELASTPCIICRQVAYIQRLSFYEDLAEDYRWSGL